MSISPAQIVQEVANAESASAPKRFTSSVPSMASLPLPPAADAEQSTAPSPAPAISASPQLSTDLRIDNQHQLYYEFVDNSTGNVVFEIPPEALRAIGESLNVPLNGDATPPSLDVKS